MDADIVWLLRQDALVDEARLARAAGLERRAGEQVVELDVAGEPVLLRRKQPVSIGIAAGAHQRLALRDDVGLSPCRQCERPKERGDEGAPWERSTRA